MDISQHDLHSLFEQLGLPASDADISRFIESHRPLPEKLRLSKADFWNPSQAAFLEQALADDSDWCEQVDQLDAQLRH